MPDPTKPGAEVTGNEQQDLDALVNRAVEEAYSKLNLKKPEDEGAKPEPIKIKVFDKEVSFDNPEAVSKAVEAAILQAREGALVEANQQKTNETKVTETKTGTFDKEKFATLLDTDILQGFNYALSHLIFQGQTENAAELLRSRIQDVDTQKQVMAAYQFREMFPQFQGDPGTIQKLDSIRQGLGLPPDNPQSWEAALALGVVRGVLPDPRQQQTQQSTNGQFQQTQRVAAPPSMGRGVGEPSADFLAKAEQLPVEDLEKLLYSLSPRR